jgi:ParB family transcriptional regulator, chromosome partitioning protein
LFAHCVAASVNAVYDPYNRRPRTLAHADRLAEALDLDMAAAGWQATVDTYLGRVTKARILAAVREARGEDAARRLEGTKKDEMAKTAQSLLADTGWLPEPLRTPGRPFASAATSEPTIDRAAPGATLESRAADSQPTGAGDGEHSDDVDGDDDARRADADGSPSDEDTEALAAAE